MYTMTSQESVKHFICQMTSIMKDWNCKEPSEVPVISKGWAEIKLYVMQSHSRPQK